jgi:uncharacterized protein YjiS (DUF1127 family)
MQPHPRRYRAQRRRAGSEIDTGDQFIDVASQFVPQRQFALDLHFFDGKWCGSEPRKRGLFAAMAASPAATSRFYLSGFAAPQTSPRGDDRVSPSGDWIRRNIINFKKARKSAQPPCAGRRSLMTLNSTLSRANGGLTADGNAFALTRIVKMIREWRHRARSRRDLMALDARALWDVRLTRADAMKEAGKPFWQE